MLNRKDLIQYCDVLNNNETITELHNEESDILTEEEQINIELIKKITENNIILTERVEEALYNFIGSLICKISKTYKVCELCVSSLLKKESSTKLSVGAFCKLREYKENSHLFYASTELLQFLLECEKYSNESCLKKILVEYMGSDDIVGCNLVVIGKMYCQVATLINPVLISLFITSSSPLEDFGNVRRRICFGSNGNVFSGDIAAKKNVVFKEIKK
ncbi:hypothetical protein ABEB36_013742 [Hypothenemus hampei]|uniref:Uncharacterized protein n=1 Tax=Hypothenemus hampei TaxID=57062 RepID=A0ABD1E5F9_HYPHA